MEKREQGHIDTKKKIKSVCQNLCSKATLFEFNVLQNNRV